MSRINTNIQAITALERMRRNQLDLTKSMERLSTGLRINRGSDDPAGLIASEVLRNEIRGIRQAIDNSSRAINVISTAEGSLNEVSSQLLDLRGLVISSANSGALSPDEVLANQQEIDAILSSIDRVANTTEFSGRHLLNGELGYQMSSVDAVALESVQLFAVNLPPGTTRSVVVQVTQSAETANLGFAGATTSAVTIEVQGRAGTEQLSFASGASIAEIHTAINSSRDVTGVSAILSAGGLRLSSTTFGQDAFVSVTPITGNFIGTQNGATVRDEGVDAGVLVNGQTAQVNGLRVDLRGTGLDSRIYLSQTFGQALSSTTFSVVGGGSIYQISPEISTNGQVHVGLPSITTANLGNAVNGFLNSLRTGGANSLDSGNFAVADDILGDAIEQISSLRGRLGSIQKNMLETNINSQQVALENVSASESIIRDADIAVEVANLTRAQILVQSTQSTLQIAMTIPQTVLSLLG